MGLNVLSIFIWTFVSPILSPSIQNNVSDINPHIVFSNPYSLPHPLILILEVELVSSCGTAGVVARDAEVGLRGSRFYVLRSKAFPEDMYGSSRMSR